MNGPIDPLQRLHEEMKGRDLLNGPNQDFKTFSSSLNTPENRQRLYGVLKDEGWQVHDFSEFESIFFPKKKRLHNPLAPHCPALHRARQVYLSPLWKSLRAMVNSR